MSLLERIERREAVVGVIGLGYVGLPLAVFSGQAGYRVVGVDVSKTAVETINAGRSHIGDIQDAEVAALVQAGRLRATHDYAVLEACDVIIICVPTPLNKNRDPDVSYIVAAGEGIAAHMRAGQLISLESTTYPGTTEGDLLPVLQKSGLTVGQDYYLCFSPERVDPGSKNWNTRNTPKVVGGLTPACQEAAVAFYGSIVDHVVPVSSPAAAEMTKIFENTFRVVNLAVVNEMAMLCDRMGLSVWEIIRAASTKPFGFMPFYPGPGVGGHCLDGQEYVFIKNGHGMEALSLADCFERLAGNPATARADVPGGTLLAPLGMEILSFDRAGRSCLRPLTHLARRQYDGPMVRIETDGGRFLTVTDQHPMLVWEAGRTAVRLARDLQMGDLLPCTRTPRHEDAPDFATAAVRALSPAAGQVVYSPEVADTHTFVTSFGLVTHNCIPIDPFYLTWKAREYDFHTRFIELAGEINLAMPVFVREKVIRALNDHGKSVKGARILVLGLAYKEDVADWRESPAFDVIRLLEEYGAEVLPHDPLLPEVHDRHENIHIRSIELTDEVIAASDCVVIVTHHSAYDYQHIVDLAPVVVDTRNATRNLVRGREKVIVL